MRRDSRGVAAIEFAMIAPVMIIGIFFGSVEVTDGLMAKKYVSRSAASLADLASRARRESGSVYLHKAELEDIFTASDAILTGYGLDDVNMRVLAIERDEDDANYVVIWSKEYTTNGELIDSTQSGYTPGSQFNALGPNQIMDAGEGLIEPGDHLLIAEVGYEFRSTLSNIAFDGVSLGARELRLPREGRTIHFCEAPGECTDDL
jgi:hypothetical protein